MTVGTPVLLCAHKKYEYVLLLFDKYLLIIIKNGKEKGLGELRSPLDPSFSK